MLKFVSTDDDDDEKASLLLPRLQAWKDHSEKTRYYDILQNEYNIIFVIYNSLIYYYLSFVHTNV